MQKDKETEEIPFFEVTGGLPLELAIEKHADLIPYLKSRNPPKLNLKNRNALLLYNLYIIQDIYGLDIILEQEKAIIPTPVLRYNFLKHTIRPNSTIIELGTGPSALIAILAAKFFHAKVYATEMDSEYLAIAKKNILRNHLEESIELIDSKGNFLKGVIPSDLSVDYVISNPPYYDKIRSSKLLWGGKPHELVSGEYGEKFVVRMIEEGFNFLKTDGIIAFMIAGKRIETLNYLNDFLKTIECNFDVFGLKAGNRRRYVYKVSKKL